MGSKNIFEIQWHWIQRNMKQWRPYAGPKFWWKNVWQHCPRQLTLARSGGLMQPPHEFFWAGRHTVWRIVLKFSIAYGASFSELLVKKKLVGSGQVTNLWRHKRNNLRKISAKSWVNATWRGAIDFNGDSWWDWCQYVTGCDPWHCDRWGSRSNKVTWGHWPRLTSQWQITNKHMFSGVSWGAESESMVQCP